MAREEVTAIFTRERHRFENPNGDVVIGSVEAVGNSFDDFSVKGQADQGELQEGQTYRFYGKWSSYKNKHSGKTEKQFAFDSFVKEQPHGRDGVIAYLLSAGEGLGLGRVRAAKCWELFGSDAVKVLRETPAIVVEKLAASGLKLAKENAEEIARQLREDAALEACTLDLLDVLNGRGFPKSTGRLAVRQWGNRAANIIRRNPYKLMNFRGCGFKRCDALYLDLKHDRNAIRRQGLCAWYTVASNTEGHTWFPLGMVDRGIRDSIAGANLKLEDALKFARRLGALSETQTNGVKGGILPGGSCRWLAEGKKAQNETDLAEAIADALSEPATMWPDVADVQGIDDHQRGELAKATRGAIGILGGSPGTGKTWTVALLIKHLATKIGIDNIRIGAPTGKAAVRVTENLSKHGLTIRARTWHSLLATLESTGSNKFPAKVLIGDETSMNDTDLMSSIFRARSAGCHVLLVGDVHQLPPVGHGAPLRDLIAAGLPYGELTEIKRNSGGIVEACAAIKNGQRWTPGDNLVLEEASTPTDQIREMLEWIADRRSVGLDPIWDCQVVVPVNKKSPLARQTLNKILQHELNTNGGEDGSPFWVGDKIVNTANGYFPLAESETDDPDEVNDRGEAYVANGELAKVVQVEPGYLVAELANPFRKIKIPRGKASENPNEQPDDVDGANSDKSTGTGCSWDLGYALSVHKSQGSEWPVVLVMLDDYAGAKMVCSREWLYTAISRARELCVMIGKRETADSMCRRVAIGNRKTLLKERIHAIQAVNVLVEM